MLSGTAAAAKSLQSCPPLCDPHRRQPTRLPRPWDSPDKNTGVGCHFLLQPGTGEIQKNTLRALEKYKSTLRAVARN